MIGRAPGSLIQKELINKKILYIYIFLRFSLPPCHPTTSNMKTLPSSDYYHVWKNRPQNLKGMLLRIDPGGGLNQYWKVIHLQVKEG